MNRITSLLLAIIISVSGAYAQMSGAGTSIEPVIEDLIRSYMPWQSVEFNGKIKYDKLPVNPTVKMYMECDSLIQISVRAPLVGEVGRLELTRGNITVVNRMKRTFFSESTDNLMDMYPGIISDIQSIFLARVTVLGSGQLGYDNYDTVSVEEDREGNWMVIPQSRGIADLRYGYIVGPNSRTKALEIILKKYFELEVLYSYAGRGLQMQINAKTKKDFHAELDFSSVKWGGTRMSPVKVDNYTRMSLKDFIKSLK